MNDGPQPANVEDQPTIHQTHYLKGRNTDQQLLWSERKLCFTGQTPREKSNRVCLLEKNNITAYYRKCLSLTYLTLDFREWKLEQIKCVQKKDQPVNRVGFC